jgi:hypothetical protein
MGDCDPAGIVHDPRYFAIFRFQNAGPSRLCARACAGALPPSVKPSTEKNTVIEDEARSGYLDLAALRVL